MGEPMIQPLQPMRYPHDTARQSSSPPPPPEEVGHPAWISATPLDQQLDGGGFAYFERTYPQSTVVTVEAPAGTAGRAFVGWRLNGFMQPGNEPCFEVLIGGQVVEIEAVYGPPDSKDMDIGDHSTIDLPGAR